MVSVAIKCENCSNIQIIGGSVKGFDIGYLFDNVRSVNINGGKLNVNNRGISFVCKGKRKTAGGFIWRFQEGSTTKQWLEST